MQNRHELSDFFTNNTGEENGDELGYIIPFRSICHQFSRSRLLIDANIDKGGLPLGLFLAQDEFDGHTIFAEAILLVSK